MSSAKVGHVMQECQLRTCVQVANIIPFKLSLIFVTGDMILLRDPCLLSFTESVNASFLSFLSDDARLSNGRDLGLCMDGGVVGPMAVKGMGEERPEPPLTPIAKEDKLSKTAGLLCLLLLSWEVGDIDIVCFLYGFLIYLEIKCVYLVCFDQ